MLQRIRKENALVLRHQLSLTQKKQHALANTRPIEETRKKEKKNNSIRQLFFIDPTRVRCSVVKLDLSMSYACSLASIGSNDMMQHVALKVLQSDRPRQPTNHLAPPKVSEIDDMAVNLLYEQYVHGTM